MADYEISPLVEPEIDAILDYTIEKFGRSQMIKYWDQLKTCLDQLDRKHPICQEIKVGSKSLRYIHCQKHYLFALERANRPLLIIAILHERMDLVARLKSRLGA